MTDAQMIAALRAELFQQAGERGDHCIDATDWNGDEPRLIPNTINFDGQIDLARLVTAIRSGA